MDADSYYGEDSPKGYSDDDDLTVRIHNDSAENGYEQSPGPLSWLNSARVTTDPQDDAVHCVVSVADPRGGFCFTVRRLSDGRIVLHCPYPGEAMLHANLAELHPGTFVITYGDGDDRPVDFSDDED